MRCLLDLDGVLVDFWKGACEFFDRPMPKWSEYKIGTDITETFGMGETHLWESLNSNFWEYLPPMSDYLEILGALELHFGRANICILSSPVINPSCMAGKQRWIEKNIPAYRRQFLFGPKKYFCAGPESVLIDDYKGNCDKFIKCGGKAYLVPREWNEGSEKLNEFLVKLS